MVDEHISTWDIYLGFHYRRPARRNKSSFTSVNAGAVSEASLYTLSNTSPRDLKAGGEIESAHAEVDAGVIARTGLYLVSFGKCVHCSKTSIPALFGSNRWPCAPTIFDIKMNACMFSPSKIDAEIIKLARGKRTELERSPNIP